MGSEYLTDSQIQSYLMYKIRLGALGWFNIETGLLENELKNYHTCYVSSISQSIYIITSLIIHILEIV
jgi:phenylalanine-4-hydroxylase